MSKCLKCECEEKRDNIGLCCSSQNTFICLSCYNAGYDYDKYYAEQREKAKEGLKENGI